MGLVEQMNQWMQCRLSEQFDVRELGLVVDAMELLNVSSGRRDNPS